MNCSLGISNFLEENASLSHSIVFLYFFALITEEGFLILDILLNSAFKWVYLSFSSLPFTLFLFSAICKPSLDNHFVFLHFFFMAWSCCPSLSPRVCSNSCPLSQWCHPTISSSVAPLSSSSQSFPASEPFPKNWLFASGGQSIRVTASVLPMNIQGWFPLGLTALISLQSKGLSRVFSSTTVQKHQFFSPQPSLWSNSHPYMTIGKKHSFVYIDICQQRDVSAF